VPLDDGLLVEPELTEKVEADGHSNVSIVVAGEAHDANLGGQLGLSHRS
jgi:hypothetical protein